LQKNKINCDQGLEFGNRVLNPELAEADFWHPEQKNIDEFYIN